MGFLELLKQNYELCIKDYTKYKEQVDSISKLFNLSGKHALLGEYLPSGFSGNYEREDSYVIFGINPGFSSTHNKTEEAHKGKSWEYYLDFRRKFYQYFKKWDHPSRYYRSFWVFFSGLIQDYSKNYATKWDFFDQRVVNLNLIPYHSRGINLSSNFTNEQLKYLRNNLDDGIEFISKYNPKIFLFNGNPWYVLLIKNHLVTEYEKVKITDKFNLYFFKIQKIPCVLFDKFFSVHFWGLKDEPHRSKIIPKAIRNHYPSLSFQ